MNELDKVVFIIIIIIIIIIIRLRFIFQFTYMYIQLLRNTLQKGVKLKLYRIMKKEKIIMNNNKSLQK